MNQKILDVAIDWMDGYGNSPSWKVLVDRECDRPFRGYERRQAHGGGFMYRAESGLQIDFMYHSGGDANDGGFGGSTYELPMKDGSRCIVKGPWSSRPAVCNMVFPDRARAVHVGLTADQKAWADKCRASWATNIKADALVDWLRDANWICKHIHVHRHDGGRAQFRTTITTEPTRLAWVSNSPGDPEQNLEPIFLSGWPKSGVVREYVSFF